MGKVYCKLRICFLYLCKFIHVVSFVCLFVVFFIDTNCHRIACKQDLYTMLADIGNWQSLCIYLGVPEAVLSDLVNEDLENNDRREKCLAAYFDQGEACWEKVIEVVAGHPFYNKKLATQIAQKYGVSWQG